MKSEIVQIVTAAVGTLGFSIYFRVSEKNVFASTLGGALGWAVYLLVDKIGGILFLSNFTAALFVYLYSEFFARRLKAPANVFLIPGIIPLLPGNALYYMMFGLVQGDAAMFAQYGKNTAQITVGIAAGIAVGAVCMMYLSKRKQQKIK